MVDFDDQDGAIANTINNAPSATHTFDGALDGTVSICFTNQHLYETRKILIRSYVCMCVCVCVSVWAVVRWICRRAKKSSAVDLGLVK